MDAMKCADWVRNELSDGELHLCDDMREESKKRGFKKAEFKHARNAIGVKTFHQFDEDGPTQNHFWYLEET